VRIGIDGRSLEEKRTGVGRYLESLLGQWALQECNDQFIVYYINKRPGDSFFENPCFCRQQVTFEDHLQADLFSREFELSPVHVFFSPLYDLPLPVPFPSVITVHDMVHRAWPEAFTDLQLSYLSTRHEYSINRADRIITDSLFSFNEILSEFLHIEKKLTIIPLAPSPLFHTFEVEPAFPSRDFGIERPFIFYVGSITPKRHVAPLLSAFEELSPLFPEWNVILAGRNVTCPYLDIGELVRNCNGRLGRKAVVYREFVSDDDLLRLYNSAGIFAYLSTYEGFGMPPLEAMACGAPVITTNCSSLPEVVGDAALMVNPLRPEEIKEALGRLMSDESLRHELQERGYRRKEMFSWAETAEKTLEIVKSVRRA